MQQSGDANRPSSRFHRKIVVEEDFDLVHNVLFYIHTNKIRFSTNLGEEPDVFNSNDPKICEAEDIYALSHRWELKDLQAKALKFLKFSCNPRNIASRIFGKYA